MVSIRKIDPFTKNRTEKKFKNFFTRSYFKIVKDVYERLIKIQIRNYQVFNHKNTKKVIKNTGSKIYNFFL